MVLTLKDESENEEDKKKKHSRNNSATNKSKNKTNSGGKRINWTDEEAIKLLVGIELYGHGQWAKIKEVNRKMFADRSSVKLKDKYRILIKPSNSDYYKRLMLEVKRHLRKEKEAQSDES